MNWPSCCILKDQRILFTCVNKFAEISFCFVKTERRSLIQNFVVNLLRFYSINNDIRRLIVFNFIKYRVILLDFFKLKSDSFFGIRTECLVYLKVRSFILWWVFNLVNQILNIYFPHVFNLFGYLKADAFNWYLCWV